MGAEGPTDDPAINALRERQIRNFLATLILSQGVPMLCGGDEVARSQRGNNNGYCQDDELTWYDWNLDAPRKRLMDFTAKLIELAQQPPQPPPPQVLPGPHRQKLPGSRAAIIKDIAWYNTDGNELPDEAWNEPGTAPSALMLNGKTLGVTDEDGHPVTDDSFLILVNAYHEGVEFTLPESPKGRPWVQLIDTQHIDDPFKEVPLSDKVILGGRSIRVFRDDPGNISAQPKPN